MSVNGSKKNYMRVYEAMWWYMDAYDGVSLFIRSYVCIWKFMMVNECKW